MKKYQLLFLILLLIGCKDEAPKERVFPIIKTLPPINNDASGATFRGEALRQGKLSTTSYGFLWSTDEPNMEDSNKVILGGKINEGEFEIRVDHSLSKGFTYYVRAFATLPTTKTIYGNVVTFKSEGIANSSWSLELTDSTLKGNGQPYGSSNNEKGFILFRSSDFYIFDPEVNEFIPAPNFPVSLNYYDLTSVSIDQVQYFFNSASEDRNLYKFENNSWSVQSELPFRQRISAYLHGHSYSNKLFILSPIGSFMYDPENNSWQDKSMIPFTGGYFVGGTSIGSKAYIVTSDKSVWEYEANNDKWTFLTTFPDILEERVISFATKNKVYFGLSSHDHFEEKDWMHRKLWSYHPASNEWELQELFPANLNSGDLFFFSLKNKLYIGHSDDGEYFNLYLFDPNEN